MESLNRLIDSGKSLTISRNIRNRMMNPTRGHLPVWRWPCRRFHPGPWRWRRPPCTHLQTRGCWVNPGYLYYMVNQKKVRMWIVKLFFWSVKVNSSHKFEIFLYFFVHIQYEIKYGYKHDYNKKGHIYVCNAVINCNNSHLMIFINTQRDRTSGYCKERKRERERVNPFMHGRF